MWLQVYMGLAWTLGCAAVGLLIVREPAECKIGRQYLCQVITLPACRSLHSHISRIFFYYDTWESVGAIIAIA